MLKMFKFNPSTSVLDYFTIPSELQRNGFPRYFSADSDMYPFEMAARGIINHISNNMKADRQKER
jgi:hypothetical protein